MSSPPTTTVPSVGDRMPPAIEQSVVLPDPDGPDEGDDLVAAERERRVVERDDLVVADRVHLAHAGHLERSVTAVALVHRWSCRVGSLRSAPDRRGRVDAQDAAERERAADDGGDEEAARRCVTMRGGVTANGIEPAGISASRTTTRRRRSTEATSVTTTAWSDDAGEERARAGADRLQHAVERRALDGEQREEQRDHDEGDHDRHADDLVEDRSLLRRRRGSRRSPRRWCSDVGGAAGGARRSRPAGPWPPSAVHDHERLEHVVADPGVGSVGVQHVAPRVGRRPQASPWPE